MLTVGVSWGVGVAVLCVVVAATSWWAEPPLAMFGQLNEQAWRCLLVLLMATGMCSLVTPWRAVLVGVQRYTVIAFADVAVGLTTSFLSVVVVLAGGGIATLAVCVCAVNAGQAVALMVLARACHPPPPIVSPGPVARRQTTFRYGVPVQVTSAASAANGEAARLVLGGMGGPAVVAGFEPGNRLAHLLHVPMAPFLMAMFPVASAAAICSDTAKVDRLYLGMTRYLAVFGSGERGGTGRRGRPADPPLARPSRPAGRSDARAALGRVRGEPRRRPGLHRQPGRGPSRSRDAGTRSASVSCRSGCASRCSTSWARGEFRWQPCWRCWWPRPTSWRGSTVRPGGRSCR